MNCLCTMPVYLQNYLPTMKYCTKLLFHWPTTCSNAIYNVYLFIIPISFQFYFLIYDGSGFHQNHYHNYSDVWVQMGIYKLVQHEETSFFSFVLFRSACVYISCVRCVLFRHAVSGHYSHVTNHQDLVTVSSIIQAPYTWGWDQWNGTHDDVMSWKWFLRHWSFVMGICWLKNRAIALCKWLKNKNHFCFTKIAITYDDIIETYIHPHVCSGLLKYNIYVKILCYCVHISLHTTYFLFWLAWWTVFWCLSACTTYRLLE